MDCSLPSSLVQVHGILQARILELVAIPFSRGLPHPGIKLKSPTLQADSLPTELLGKPLTIWYQTLNKYTCVFKKVYKLIIINILTNGEKSVNSLTQVSQSVLIIPFMSDYSLPFIYCQKFKSEPSSKFQCLSFQICYFQAYASAVKEPYRYVWHSLQPGPDLPLPLKFDQEKNLLIMTDKGEEEGFFHTARGRPASKLAHQVT